MRILLDLCVIDPWIEEETDDGAVVEVCYFCTAPRPTIATGSGASWEHKRECLYRRAVRERDAVERLVEKVADKDCRRGLCPKNAQTYPNKKAGR